MSRPLLLDLFCGAGGASVGYHRAGFDVIGMDIEPQPNYPFEFYQKDAIGILSRIADKSDGWPHPSLYDAIHVSPPCQDHSSLKMHSARGTGWMLAATRFYLEQQHRPWVIENVDGSGLAEQGDLFGTNGLLLCGAMFGAETYRHRLFESSTPLRPRHHPKHLVPTSSAGHWKPGTYISVAGHCHPIEMARKVMGIDWMTRDELAEAIPPAFTEYIGGQLLEHLQQRGAA